MKNKFASLKLENDFKKVFSKGKRISNKFFKAAYLTNETGQVKLSISASKKLGSAATRNRIRRRLKEAFRVRSADIRGRVGANVAIFPFISGKTEGFNEIKQVVDAFFGKIGLK